jgi:hypothetical protein
MRATSHTFADEPLEQVEYQQAQVMSWEDLVSCYDFGPAAFEPIEAPPTPTQDDDSDDDSDTDTYVDDLQGSVASLVLDSVPAVEGLRGQRGERLVTEMLTACYGQGLFMHGPPSSPLNSLIIPAIRHIFQEMAKLPSSHGKRIDYLSTLAYACQDCQQVQAREIMRIYGDMTAQTATLEKQFKYSLMRDKEAALHRFISERHPRCDLDWTQVKPWQQRPHLMSGYAVLVGEGFGLDGITAAQSDRYLTSAVSEIGDIDCDEVLSQLRQNLSMKAWLQMLLADVNNQTEGADRLIDRDCIFKWVDANMDTKSAYAIFYDEDRKAEFANLDPQRPIDANQFQPFLSLRVLVDILLAAGLLVER